MTRYWTVLVLKFYAKVFGAFGNILSIVQRCLFSCKEINFIAKKCGNAKAQKELIKRKINAKLPTIFVK